jgi:Uma2 family endonuclease
MSQRASVLDETVEDIVRSYERGGPLPVDEESYVRIVEHDPDTRWELHDGLLVEKPGVSIVHGGTVIWLRDSLIPQLDRNRYLVFTDSGRLRRSTRNYFVPDLAVIPTELFHRHRQMQPDGLTVFNEPIPFVAEVWSRSTGRYDVNEKIPVYQRRGDIEIWRLQPYERALTVWRRQADGSHEEAVYNGGLVQVASLPGVTIDLDALFDFR